MNEFWVIKRLQMHYLLQIFTNELKIYLSVEKINKKVIIKLVNF